MLSGMGGSGELSGEGNGGVAVGWLECARAWSGGEGGGDPRVGQGGERQEVSAGVGLLGLRHPWSAQRDFKGKSGNAELCAGREGGSGRWRRRASWGSNFVRGSGWELKNLRQDVFCILCVHSGLCTYVFLQPDQRMRPSDELVLCTCASASCTAPVSLPCSLCWAGC